MNFDEIFLQRLNLENYSHHSLSENYHFRFYQEGDEENWRRIHKLSDVYNVTEPIFDKYFASGIGALMQRQIYLCDSDGLAVGTATAWKDTFFDQQYGRVHWVAIVPEHQNKGLAKPLLSFVLEQFVKLNYKKVFLRTISVRHNAIGLYLFFGFVPVIRNENELVIWQRIALYVKHPTLDNLAINI